MRKDKLRRALQYLWVLLPFIPAVAIAVFYGTLRMGDWLTTQGAPGWLAYPFAISCFVVAACLSFPRQRWLRPHAAGVVAYVFLVGAAGRLLSEYSGNVARPFGLAGVCALPVLGAPSLVLWLLARRRLLAARQVLDDFSSLQVPEAQRAAGRPGHTFDVGLIRVWTDLAEAVDAEVMDAVDLTLIWYAFLTGFPRAVALPFGMLVFERNKAFDAYVDDQYSDPRPCGGFCSTSFLSLAVLYNAHPEWGAGGVRRTVSHELVHHLMGSHSKTHGPPWLGEGLATLIGEKVGGSAEYCAGVDQRRLRAADARGDLLAPDEFFGMTYAEYRRHKASSEEAERWERAHTFVLHSASFVRFLHDSHPALLHRVLRSGEVRRPDEFRRSPLAADLGRVMSEFLTQLRQADLPAHEAPSIELKGWIKAELIVRITDPERPLPERRWAVGAMGDIGSPWQSGVLVDILGETDHPLRPDALRALQNIAGEGRSDDPAAWREWLAALPNHVRGGGGAVEQPPPSTN